jgi:iduronate 2-sulfatase
MKRIPTLAALAGFAAVAMGSGAQTKPMNVLFIAVDDLRPELGCYGHPVVKSPHIDQLAATGAAFSRAYCNIAVCGASRASIMSGVRPGVKRFVGHDCYLDQHLPGAVSLPMHFRNNGYRTISLGKVFHHQNDSKGSWDVNWRPKSDNGSSWRDYLLPENLALDVRDNGRGMPYEKADVPDVAYFDGKIALKAIEEMKIAAAGNKPFFLAVGFLKPHLPFNAPAKYWDLYSEKDIRLPMNGTKPKDAPDVSMHTFGELRAYAGIPPSGPVPDELAKKLIHGYYACVSYTDAQIGKLLEALDEAGLAEQTIVVLWGDHGYHLAEKGLWCKHCNYEKVLRVPLIVRAPGFAPKVKSDHLVELVDVYPTLCDLAGLAKPFQLQGNSLVPLLMGENPVWKDAVFSRWVKGETIITRDRSYTAWINDPSESPFARMMYDYATDPDETVNVSGLPGYESDVKDLHYKLTRHLEERERIVLP